MRVNYALSLVRKQLESDMLSLSGLFVPECKSKGHCRIAFLAEGNGVVLKQT